MTPIIVCSRRNTDADWDDLDLAVRSMLHYTPADVWVFWQQVDGGPGPQADWTHDPAVCMVAQPDDIDTFGAAYEFAINRVLLEHDTPVHGLVIANDDIVLRPDTWELLTVDVEALREDGHEPAVVACRSNYVRGIQQSLGPETVVVEEDAVSPLFAWLNAGAATSVEWPHCNWYSDDILCHDWRKAGYSVWTSRAWVHHIGERSTRANGETQQDLNRDGLAWLHAHRPDVAQALGAAR